MGQVAIVTRTNDHHLKFTWQAIVEDYGNTFGAHLSRTVPEILDQVQYLGVGPTDFGSYMLRSLGVVASAAAHQLLREQDSCHQLVEHESYFHGTEISEVLYLRKEGKDDLRVELRRKRWNEAGRIMTVRNAEGKLLCFSILQGGRLSLEVVENVKSTG